MQIPDRTPGTHTGTRGPRRKITTTLNTYGHLFPALDEELAGRLDNMARDSGVARLWHDRRGNVVALQNRTQETASDQDVSPWALVGSNHRPPPCKGGSGQSPDVMKERASAPVFRA